MATATLPQKNNLEKLFFILIGIILLCIMLSSCVTQRQRDRILKDCVTSSVTKDSIIQIIKEKRIPYLIKDSFPYFLPNPCPELCDSLGRIKSTFVAQIKGKNGSNMILKVENNKLVLNNETVSKGLIMSKDTITKEFHEVIKEVRDNCKLEHLTKWDSFWIRVGQILSGFICALIALWAIKKF